jgi:acetyl esterase/lipase
VSRSAPRSSEPTPVRPLPVQALPNGGLWRARLVLKLWLILHGGGFVMGDLDTEHPPATRLADDSGAVVISVQTMAPCA